MEQNSSSSQQDTGSARVIGLSDTESVFAFQRLRYKYFVQQRQWIAPVENSLRLEYDCYDAVAHHIGVFDNKMLLGYLRALPWTEQHGFMVEHEFSCLLSDAELRNLNRAEALEISRLVLSDDVSLHDSQRVPELLFKALYHLAKKQKKSILYLVVEESWIAPFQRRFHFPVRRMGSSYTFPDGTRTVAASINLRDVETLLAQRDPNKLSWYQQNASP